MAIPVNPNEEVWHVPACDRDLPEDQQSAFRIRALTMEERLDAEALLRDTKHLADHLLRLVHLGLCGWRNFPPGAEDDAGFRLEQDGAGGRLKRRLAAETLDLLPTDILVELAQAIKQRSSVGARMEGN